MSGCAAIIAEFNPFHNGHKYLIEQVRSLTGADRVIALMSGDYVQRGLPAITDRRVRSQMALLNGVDLVLSYPVRYCTSSAESFASHAVEIIDRLGFVDYLAFGSEAGDVTRLSEAARLLADESASYKEKLKAGLKGGLSYPRARAEALPEYADLLDGPNNTLGIEYIKALIRRGSSIQPFTVGRKGASHLDEETIASLSSGAAVRRAMAMGDHIPGLDKALPPDAFEILREDIGRYGIISEKDLSLLLAERLWHLSSPAVFACFADVTDDLAHAIINKRTQFRDFADFAEKLKTRNLTRSHIDRALLHLTLDIRKEAADIGDTLYAHVIGFRKDKEDLLGLIKEKSSLPLVTRAAKADEVLSGEKLKLFEEEMRVSNLYETVRAQKSGEPFRSVITKPIVVV